MNTNLTPQIGRQENGPVSTATELLAALTSKQYDKLVGFARYRLWSLIQSQHLQHCLATLRPEDLVAEAVLKLELGDQDPALGRHLAPEYRSAPERFLACIKGIIESDLNHLATAARTRYPELPVGDPDVEPGTVDPVSPEDTYAVLSRRDLHQVLFRQLYARIHRQPALLAVVQDWEQRFPDGDRIGHGEQQPRRVLRVRLLVQEILHELSTELEAGWARGRELVL